MLSKYSMPLNRFYPTLSIKSIKNVWIKPIRLISLILSSLWLTIPTVIADVALHPKIEAALKQDQYPGGFIFDIQSSDPNYLADSIGYLRDQITQIKNINPSLEITIISRGTEMEQLINAEYQSKAFRILENLHRRLKVNIWADIKIASALGYVEGSFPKHVKLIGNSQVALVNGRESAMIIVPLQQMTTLEELDVKLSPTWRTDPLFK